MEVEGRYEDQLRWEVYIFNLSERWDSHEERCGSCYHGLPRHEICGDALI